jgi:hypothetical protein
VTENFKNITVGYEMKWFQCGGTNEPNFRFSSPILGLVLLHEILRVRDILQKPLSSAYCSWKKPWRKWPNASRRWRAGRTRTCKTPASPLLRIHPISARSGDLKKSKRRRGGQKGHKGHRVWSSTHKAELMTTLRGGSPENSPPTIRTASSACASGKRWLISSENG